MANDPNRDFLPVKDVDDRSSKAGINYRMDLNIIGKLKRCDLEERYMRLYDENTQIKKQLNCQEEKIKRLGTKLLRLIGEKKNCPDSCRRRQDGKGADELQMRIIELEHENYTLKDRNVVLKQQLANHARQHVAAHRSPNRSIHNSPRMSQRQSSAPNVNESNYMLSNRNQAHDIQLREAEEHINGLNDEIKSLHNKIDVLQQDLERSSLENQKTKVCENIELIRLQRSLKQQSVQIAALQAQIKNSEKNQRLLRDELASAHKENEESLQVISDKQKEILDLYTKLEERNVGRLECEEMKERIKDLTSERDSLRERGEFLMKTIESKSSEAEMIKELKRLLESEKCKKKELKESLENTQKLLQSLKDIGKVCQTSEEAISKAAVTEEEEEEADKTVGTVEEKSRSGYSKNGQGNELDFLASPRAIYPNERNSDSWEADSKVEDREGGKYPMGSSSSTVPAQTGTNAGCETCAAAPNNLQEKTAQAPLPERNGEQSEEETLRRDLARCLNDLNTYINRSESEPLMIMQAPPDFQTQQRSQVPRYSQGPPVLQVPQYSQGPSVPQVPQYSQGPPVPQVPQYSQGPLVPQVPRYSQGPPVPQVPQYSQGPPDPQVPRYSQGPPVLQVPQYSQGPPVPQVPQYSQGMLVPQVPQYSQGPPVPQVPQYSQGPPVPQVPQYSQGPPVPQVPQYSQGPPVPQVSQYSQGPPSKHQSAHYSQTPEWQKVSNGPGVLKEKKKWEAKINLNIKQNSDVGKVLTGSQTMEVPKAKKNPQQTEVPKAKKNPQTTEVPKDHKNPQTTEVPKDHKNPQKTEVPKDHQGPQTSAVSQTTRVSKKKKKSKAKQNLEIKQDSDLEKVPPVSRVPSLIQDFDELITPQTFVKLSIDWLQLKRGTSIWNDESIKLLYVDFAFFDVRGEETETPVSVCKPKNPTEKCFFNFTTGIRITKERANCLKLIRHRHEEGLIVFKVVSEPEETDEECVDVGVANLTVGEFFKSNPNSRILLPVYSTNDLKECIGCLSVRLDVSPGKL